MVTGRQRVEGSQQVLIPAAATVGKPQTKAPLVLMDKFIQLILKVETHFEIQGSPSNVDGQSLPLFPGSEYPPSAVLFMKTLDKGKR